MRLLDRSRGRRCPGRPFGLLAAAALLVALGATAGHAHPDGAEYPQACAICQAGHLPASQAPPPAVPAALRPTGLAPSIDPVALPPILPVPVSRRSRAPPASPA